MSSKEKVIALGFFDGVHLGHAALLRRTVEEAAARGATPAVFTFDRVPKEVLTGIPCPLINSPEDRKDLVRRCLLYTSPSPRDIQRSRMPSSA